LSQWTVGLLREADAYVQMQGPPRVISMLTFSSPYGDQVTKQGGEWVKTGRKQSKTARLIALTALKNRCRMPRKSMSNAC